MMLKLSKRHAASISILLLAALLLSGCGLMRRVFPRMGQGDAETTPTPEIVIDPLPPVRPARFADFDDRTYMPDRLIIPAIDLDTPVVELGWSATSDPGGRVFNQWDVAEYSAGWHKNSAQMGIGGNVVMSGHNNILGSVFRELDQLDQGDTAEVWSGNVSHLYEIESVIIVPDAYATAEQRRQNAQWISEFGDDRLTLVSCWPRDDNTHRIIVVAHRRAGANAAN